MQFYSHAVPEGTRIFLVIPNGLSTRSCASLELEWNQRDLSPDLRLSATHANIPDGTVMFQSRVDTWSKPYDMPPQKCQQIFDVFHIVFAVHQLDHFTPHRDEWVFNRDTHWKRFDARTNHAYASPTDQIGHFRLPGKKEQ